MVREFSLNSRHGALEHASGSPVDVVVVGAGITGAGVAREAALRGYGVLLLDKSDFASGTSGRSSKLVHGGIRYLAQGDIGLVKEAARERAVLRRIAPHLVRPVRMLIPVGSRRAKMKMAAGLWTFDRLAGDANAAPHQVLDRDAVRQVESGLRRDHLAGGLAYTEFVTDDARLTLATAKSAARAGAFVANHAEVTGVERNALGLRLTVEDRLADEQLVVNARCLVNAAGPWFDRVRGIYDNGASPLLQLTRGIHLVFRHARLPIGGSVVLRASDGRSTFAVPRGEYVYVGTTDTMYEGAPEEPGISTTDVSYLLESLAATFVDAPTAADVVGAWSGVRPLLREEGKNASEISRRDEIRVGPGPVVAIAGGKLTTYRRMAERVVDRVAEIVGASPHTAGASATLPLVGGDMEGQRRARESSPRLNDAALEERVWGTHGSEASSIVRTMVSDPGSMSRVGDLDELTVAELQFAIEQEMTATLDDLLRRRTRVGLFDIRRACAAAAMAADALGARLGWSAAQVAAESGRFVNDRSAELAAVTMVAERGAA
jgi:glycerol-3-phosphate dehydrogenase